MVHPSVTAEKQGLPGRPYLPLCQSLSHAFAHRRVPGTYCVPGTSSTQGTGPGACSLRAAIFQMMKRLVAVKCPQHPEGLGVLDPLCPRAGATLLLVYLTEYLDENTQVKTLCRGAVSWLLDFAQPHSRGTVSANRQDGGSAPCVHEGTRVESQRK